jgi:hypothetical protein
VFCQAPVSNFRRDSRICRFKRGWPPSDATEVIFADSQQMWNGITFLCKRARGNEQNERENERGQASTVNEQGQASPDRSTPLFITCKLYGKTFRHSAPHACCLSLGLDQLGRERAGKRNERKRVGVDELGTSGDRQALIDQHRYSSHASFMGKPSGIPPRMLVACPPRHLLPVPRASPPRHHPRHRTKLVCIHGNVNGLVLAKDRRIDARHQHGRTTCHRSDRSGHQSQTATDRARPPLRPWRTIRRSEVPQDL